MKKPIFIAGRYSAPTILDIESNINKAREVALWCASNKIFYFCPHLNSAYFDQWLPEIATNFYYEMDLCFAQLCSAAIMLPAWELSIGATSEYHDFTRNNKPVFYWPNEEQLILKWYKE